MTRFLRARKIRTIRLTPRMVAEAKTKIGASHVVLVSQLFRAGEGTWGVVYADFYYHNFDAYVLSSLAFLNKPIMSAYLIIHPKWRMGYATREGTQRAGTKGRQLTLASMRKHAEFTHLRSWT